MSIPWARVLGEMRTETSPSLAPLSISTLSSFGTRWWWAATRSAMSPSSKAALLLSSSAYLMLLVKTSVTPSSEA